MAQLAATRLIALSGREGSDPRAALFDHYLLKPVELDKLAALL